MLSKKQISNLKKIVHGNLEENVSMKNHTSFRIGGIAKIVIFPKEITDLIDAIIFLEKAKCKYFCFGLGTNLLVCDEDISNLVLIKLGSNFNHITIDNNKIIAYAGASINSICMKAYNGGLSGMEDAFGIPGTIGGAVCMNASAFNFETKNVVKKVIALVDGKITILNDLKFGYRKSIFDKLNDAIILQVELYLQYGNKPEIKARMAEVMNIRKTTQPLEYPSAGSVFKRNNDLIVSYEIDKMGLKGTRIGNAMISEKHAGFIINLGNAKSFEVKELINLIIDRFETEKGVKLEREIKYLGDK